MVTCETTCREKTWWTKGHRRGGDLWAKKG
jgi:hypothetical protein